MLVGSLLRWGSILTKQPLAARILPGGQRNNRVPRTEPPSSYDQGSLGRGWSDPASEIPPDALGSAPQDELRWCCEGPPIGGQFRPRPVPGAHGAQEAEKPPDGFPERVQQRCRARFSFPYVGEYRHNEPPAMFFALCLSPARRSLAGWSVHSARYRYWR